MPSKPKHPPLRVRDPDWERIARIAKRRGWTKTEVVNQALNALEQRKERR